MFGRRGGNSSPLGSSVSQVIKKHQQQQSKADPGVGQSESQQCQVRDDSEILPYGREELLRTREVFWYYKVPRDQLTEEVFATLMTRGSEPEKVLDELRALFLREIDAVSQYYQESIRAGRLPAHSARPTGMELSVLSNQELLSLLLYNIDPCWLERFYCPQLLHADVSHDNEVAEIMRNNRVDDSNNAMNLGGKNTPTSPLQADAGSSKHGGLVGGLSMETSAYQFEDLEVRHILSRGATLQEVLLNREMTQLKQEFEGGGGQSEFDEGERVAYSEIVLGAGAGQDSSDYEEEELSVQSECRYLHDSRRIKALPISMLGPSKTLDRKLMSHTSLTRNKQPISNVTVELSAELIGKLRNWFQVTEAYSSRNNSLRNSIRKLRFWEMDDLGFTLKKRKRIRLWKFLKKLFYLKPTHTQKTTPSSSKVNIMCMVGCTAPRLQHKYSRSFDSQDRGINI